MTVELTYDLQSFRIEQKELFNKFGQAYSNVNYQNPAERMLKLINQLEKELKEADEIIDELGEIVGCE